MNKYQNLALNHYLSSWPVAASFEEITGGLCDQNDIVATEVYEEILLHKLYSEIKDLASKLERVNIRLSCDQT